MRIKSPKDYFKRWLLKRLRLQLKQFNGKRLLLQDEFNHLIDLSVEKAVMNCFSGRSSDAVPWMQLYAALKMPPGKVAVDVGACVGQVSMFLSDFFEQVLAIEPSTGNMAVLKQVLRINGINNVATHCAAMSSEAGRGIFYLHESRGHHSLGQVSTSRNIGHEEVEITTIDDLIPEQIDFLKIDVEGYELEVLLGATEALNRGIPIVVLEVSVGPARDLGRDPWEAVRYLQDRGYTCVRADGRALDASAWHVDVLAFQNSESAERAIRLLQGRRT